MQWIDGSKVPRKRTDFTAVATRLPYVVHFTTTTTKNKNKQTDKKNSTSE